MKLYKFRPLANEHDLDRLKEIIKTGEFWCSAFYDLNDPMEAFFSFWIDDKNKKVFKILIENIYKEKTKYKICSFSGEKAFKDSLMWGYYANGFKGVVIEIKIEDSNNIHKIDYQNSFGLSSDGVQILTRKKKDWKHEDEYRFLEESEENKHKIGKIENIWFGSPYGRKLENSSDILKGSKKLRKYYFLKNELEIFIENNNTKITNKINYSDNTF